MKYDEEDEVIEEFAVYVASSENDSDKLVLLQYPTHSPESFQLDGEIIEARLRPECWQMELVQQVETQDKIYNTSLGEQIALNVDGPLRDLRDSSDNYFPSGVADRTLLRSDCPITSVETYAVGQLKPGIGLVLKPLDAVVPMRPALDYLDKADDRVKSEKKAEEDALGDGPSTEDVMKPVTVRFERDENERMKNARERSFNFQQRKIQEEPWVSLEYTGLGNSKGEHLNTLTFDNLNHEKLDLFSLAPSNYISLVVPPRSDQHLATGSASVESKDTPRSILHSFTVEKQIEKIMRRAIVARFKEIVECLESDTDRVESSLIEKVQASATLVQGCWVLKSDLLYPSAAAAAAIAEDATQSTPMTIGAKSKLKSSKKNLTNGQTESGTPHTTMHKAREYALYLLAKRSYLERSELEAVTPVPGQDLLPMLRGIATPLLTPEGQGTGRWNFRLPADTRFMSQYKDVNKRYTMMWDYQHHARLIK